MEQWPWFRRLMAWANAPISEGRMIVDIAQAAQEYRDAVEAQNAFVDQVRNATAAVTAAEQALAQAQAAAADPTAGFQAAQAVTAEKLAQLEAAALGGVVVETI
jgi:hypothetical protein